MKPRRQTDLDLVIDEYVSASLKFPKFNSPHEGYAVLLEEVEELWQEVMKKPSKRSKARMKAEAKQIAAMALRFMNDCT